MRREGATAVVATALLAACGGTISLGQDYNSEYDLVLSFCDENITIDETCTPIESSTGDRVYAHALFGRAAGHSVSVISEIVQGGDYRDESATQQVPAGERLRHSVEIFRSPCTGTPCKIVVKALVDGDVKAEAGFTFE